MENFNTILDFQEEDCSFKLFDSHFVLSDARVEFWHMSYMCTAFLIGSYGLTDEVKPALTKGLKIYCTKNLLSQDMKDLEVKLML